MRVAVLAWMGIAFGAGDAESASAGPSAGGSSGHKHPASARVAGGNGQGGAGSATDARERLEVARRDLEAGQFARALATLQSALPQAVDARDSRLQVETLSSLGATLTLLRRHDEAEVSLERALEAARLLEKDAVLGGVLNELGNLDAARGRFEQALKRHSEAANLARRSDDSPLEARASANAALSACRLRDRAQVEVWSARLGGAAERLGRTREGGRAQAAAGALRLRMAELWPVDRTTRVAAARAAFEVAASIAESEGDGTTRARATGGLAEVELLEGKPRSAWVLSRRAAFLAQAADSQAEAFRWEWLAARALRGFGETGETLQAYRRAVGTLAGVRLDLSLERGNRFESASFRSTHGRIYLELADLLLTQAGAANGLEPAQQAMREAIEVLEQLRSAEMEDYFGDECVSLAQSTAVPIDSLARGTAVVYLIPLEDRTEVLLGIAGRLDRWKVPIGAGELGRTVAECRHLLEKRTTFEYLRPAWRLYDELIRPMESVLRERGVDTLVFLPDGALRSIPFASLHDGERFLVERYAVAVTPGLSLMDPRPTPRKGARVLVTGLSESVQGFPALPHVPAEMESLHAAYPGSFLMDRDFRMASVEKRLQEDRFALVHIASHAQFEADPAKTFLLTWDGKLTLDRLEAMIRPGQFRGQAVELLALSACQTAAGDDRSALGLAGVAVKAGARSALASLWFVNDQASSALVRTFYEEIRRDASCSKAEALRRAQLGLMRDFRYRHPCYWSAYLVIGNWL